LLTCGNASSPLVASRGHTHRRAGFCANSWGISAAHFKTALPSFAALNASYLERVSRMQELVLDQARTRTGQQDPTDPRTPAIIGAAFSCLIAAWTTWLNSNQARPFGDLLDQAMDAIHPT
jgi:hypothetical protein